MQGNNRKNDPTAPFVSIILPVYKVEPYLRRCVDSILSQTYTDYELILVDDGSPDNCGVICDEYAEKYDNISVIHKENGGLSDARNTGTAIAKGEWGLFIDSDDLIHPQTLEFLVKTAEETNANIVSCGRLSAASVPDGFFDERILSYRVFDINEEMLVEFYGSPVDIISDLYWVVVPKLARMSVLKKFPFTVGRIHEDNAVAFRWITAAKRVAVVDEELYFYMINQNGIMHSKFSPKKLDFLWALEQQIEFYRQKGYKKILKVVVEDYFRNAVYFGKRIVSELNDDALCRKLMKETEKKAKLFSTFCDFELDLHTKNYIMKYAHPLRFKLNKKIGNFKPCKK